MENFVTLFSQHFALCRSNYSTTENYYFLTRIVSVNQLFYCHYFLEVKLYKTPLYYSAILYMQQYAPIQDSDIFLIEFSDLLSSFKSFSILFDCIFTKFIRNKNRSVEIHYYLNCNDIYLDFVEGYIFVTRVV